MIPHKLLLSLICVASVAVQAAPPRREPPKVIPTANAAVARNAKVWVFDSSAQVEILDRAGNPVSATATVFDSTLTRLTPESEFVPGSYSLRLNGDDVVQFTVTDQIDSTPPVTPVPSVGFAQGRVGQLSSFANLTIATAVGEQDIQNTFLIALDEFQTWDTSIVLAASKDGSLFVPNLPAGESRLKVLRIDAAGNASMPAELVVTTPANRSCSVAPMLPLSLLALVLVRRRRVS